MSGDDPRHGTVQGYSRLGCRCHACRRAVNRYNKQRRLDELRGLPSRYVSVVGTRRRLEALRALGWSMEQVAVRAGMDPGNLRRLVIKQSRVSRKVAARFAELYDQMSMTLPPERTQYERRSVRQARQAAFENGWLPPLAWDDIDSDVEPTTAICENSIDEVVVDRILSGDWRLPSTREERTEVARRWCANGGSTHQLTALTGWKVERYFRKGEAA